MAVKVTKGQISFITHKVHEMLIFGAIPHYNKTSYWYITSCDLHYSTFSGSYCLICHGVFFIFAVVPKPAKIPRLDAAADIPTQEGTYIVFTYICKNCCYNCKDVEDIDGWDLYK